MQSAVARATTTGSRSWARLTTITSLESLFTQDQIEYKHYEQARASNNRLINYIMATSVDSASATTAGGAALSSEVLQTGYLHKQGKTE